MAWKVQHKKDGSVIQLGLSSEDSAQDWLDKNPDLQADDFLVAEMDEDETAEWEESLEDAGGEDVPDDFEEQYSAYTDPDGEGGDIADRDMFDHVVGDDDI
jgi:hypothetical protein